MATCDNCGRDSDLMLSVEKKGVKLWEYCPEYKCVEEGKAMIISMKGQIMSTHFKLQEKGGDGAGE